MHTKFWRGNVKKTSLGGRVKWILKKWDGIRRTALIWLRTGRCCGLLYTPHGSFGFHMWEISGLADKLSASQATPY